MSNKITSLISLIMSTTYCFGLSVGEMTSDAIPILLSFKNISIIIITLIGLFMSVLSMKKSESEEKKKGRINFIIGLCMMSVGCVSYYFQGNELFEIGFGSRDADVIEEFTLEQYEGGTYE
ncbi:hypothetical protein [Vibrio sp. 1CM23M]|uniref:hypothetical protein n=1 Tax=Vibrio sp. 1CM23M TaxID=2929164 RepID=UPI0020C08596|nr:hypothetical protein [Vibrio sp. 1CM23M]MCK8072415.1 hypothetical protein [Vibrio sp. 1CM23M]